MPRALSQRRFHDRGAGFAEYAAAILLVAAVASVVLASGVGTTVRNYLEDAICKALPDGCEDREPSGNPSSTTGGGNSDDSDDGASTPGGDENDPDRPSDEELEAVEDDIADIRDHLNGNWFTNLLSSDPEDVMADMSAAELNALFWSLSEDEIEELLSDDSVRDLTLRNADLDTLRRIQNIDPDLVGPDFDDTDGAKEAKQDDDIDHDLDYAEVEDGQLYGDNGEISSDDIDQGSLNNCWWLAGIGAVADQNPEMIKDMISENDNGTYTVTFADGEEVVVTPDIVVDSSGNAEFSDPGSDAVMWPAILEKAHAEREGGYGETEWGLASDSMELVTGNDVEEVPAGDVTEGQLNDWLTGDDPHAVTLFTLGEDKDNKHEDLVNNHFYIVESVEDGQVELYNPWGGAGDHETISIEELNANTRQVDAAPIS
ncbi:hypothetical protein F4561_001612 [Lipingzhangella halophila]|uniref:Calpain catalytic domain-containing protein n=1 Tax=Lipingzhangella halophila TaxID=1783352 RepID=A0A7W7W1B7_9ACTN|nr:C2 family cysteine protease [Lipingzhangella halophila]MBB4930792.1 hypothetical protein [Lipingzhangella halophila]